MSEGPTPLVLGSMHMHKLPSSIHCIHNLFFVQSLSMKQLPFLMLSTERGGLLQLAQQCKMCGLKVLTEKFTENVCLCIWQPLVCNQFPPMDCFTEYRIPMKCSSKCPFKWHGNCHEKSVLWIILLHSYFSTHCLIHSYSCWVLFDTNISLQLA